MRKLRVPPKRQYSPTKLHGATIQMITIWKITTANFTDLFNIILFFQLY
jgi:hypothetical protein